MHCTKSWLLFNAEELDVLWEQICLVADISVKYPVFHEIINEASSPQLPYDCRTFWETDSEVHVLEGLQFSLAQAFYACPSMGYGCERYYLFLPEKMQRGEMVLDKQDLIHAFLKLTPGRQQAVEEITLEAPYKSSLIDILGKVLSEDEFNNIHPIIQTSSGQLFVPLNLECGPDLVLSEQGGLISIARYADNRIACPKKRMSIVASWQYRKVLHIMRAIERKLYPCYDSP